MKKAIDFFTAHPARFFLLAALLWGWLMCILNHKDEEFNPHDLLVEASGMVFDLLVFGVLFYIYEESRQKNERVNRYKEKLDDLRGCVDNLAAYRTAGVIRRLTKNEKIYDLDLNRVYVSGTNLSGLQLKPKCNLSGATFEDTDLTDAILVEADLHDSNLSLAKLIRANLSGADFKRANLTKADLLGANLSGADLLDAFLEKDFINYNWFDQLESWQVIGRDAIRQTYRLEEEGKRLVFKR